MENAPFRAVPHLRRTINYRKVEFPLFYYVPQSKEASLTQQTDN